MAVRQVVEGPGSRGFMQDPKQGTTLPETNGSPINIPIFPGKYHQNGGFSMAMLVSQEGNISHLGKV